MPKLTAKQKKLETFLAKTTIVLADETPKYKEEILAAKLKSLDLYLGQIPKGVSLKTFRGIRSKVEGIKFPPREMMFIDEKSSAADVATFLECLDAQVDYQLLRDAGIDGKTFIAGYIKDHVSESCLNGMKARMKVLLREFTDWILKEYGNWPPNSKKLIEELWKLDESSMGELVMSICGKVKFSAGKSLPAELCDKPEDNSVDSVVIYKGFKSSYHDNQHDMEEFMSIVDEIFTGKPSKPTGAEQAIKFTKCTPIVYFSPYSVILQSSCAGKSRFLFEPKRNDDRTIMSVVVVCKPENARSYPPGSDFYDQILKVMENGTPENRVIKMAHILALIVLEAKNYFFDSEGQLLKSAEITGGIFVDILFEKNRELTLPSELPDMSTFGTMKDRRGKDFKLVVAFDEASGLLEVEHEVRGDKGVGKLPMFRILRRALAHLVDNGLIVPCFFASTSSKIGNFMPSSEIDTSAALQVVTGDESPIQAYLHRPLILHGTYDTLERYRLNPRDIKSWTEHMKSRRYIADLTFFGRPVWGSVYLSSGWTLENVFKFLFGKFIGVKAASFNAHLLNETVEDKVGNFKWFVDTLWVLGRTIHLPPISTSRYTYDLVNSRMGHLHSFNQFTNVGVVGFPSEPMVSALAMSYFTDGCAAYMGSLTQMVCYSNLDIGYYGELVARAVLLLKVGKTNPISDHYFADPEEHEKNPEMPRRADSAEERANDKFAADRIGVFGSGRRYVGLIRALLPRKLADFLNEISPALKKSLSSRITQFPLEEALVSFSHFQTITDLSKTNHNIKYLKKLLKGGLQRHSALIMGIKNFEAVDLVVPFAFPGGVGGILVQVKNHEKISNRIVAEALQKMDMIWGRAEEHGIPLISLLISLGGEWGNVTNEYYEPREAGKRGKEMAKADKEKEIPKADKASETNKTNKGKNKAGKGNDKGKDKDKDKRKRAGKGKNSDKPDRPTNPDKTSDIRIRRPHYCILGLDELNLGDVKNPLCALLRLDDRSVRLTTSGRAFPAEKAKEPFSIKFEPPPKIEHTPDTLDCNQYVPKAEFQKMEDIRYFRSNTLPNS